jgi:hypothetical protein
MIMINEFEMQAREGIFREFDAGQVWAYENYAACWDASMGEFKTFDEWLNG